jgi:acyl carrier protein
MFCQLTAKCGDELRHRRFTPRTCAVDHIQGWKLTRLQSDDIRTFGLKRHRKMSSRAAIVAAIEQIVNEQKLQLPALTDDLVLLESGLDSLGFAILVTRLEETLGVDPFSTPDDVDFPVTLGDFVSVYDNAAKTLAVAL